jgi:hypothetical protein
MELKGERAMKELSLANNNLARRLPADLTLGR